MAAEQRCDLCGKRLAEHVRPQEPRRLKLRDEVEALTPSRELNIQVLLNGATADCVCNGCLAGLLAEAAQNLRGEGIAPSPATTDVD
jgi:hypothetical protein